MDSQYYKKKVNLKEIKLYQNYFQSLISAFIIQQFFYTFGMSNINDYSFSKERKRYSKRHSSSEKSSQKQRKSRNDSQISKSSESRSFSRSRSNSRQRYRRRRNSSNYSCSSSNSQQRNRRRVQQRLNNMNKYTKTVLRHLESRDIKDYIATQKQKQDLRYPPQNIPNQMCDASYQLVSLDCETLITCNGIELLRLVIIDYGYNILYDSWFEPQGQVTDYVTHITGVSKQNINQKKLIKLDQQQINKINIILQKKIIVGHDLTNDLAVLPIKNKLFIDTVLLYPHNNGLPQKQSLKRLSMYHLERVIQWNIHDPIQDAKAALDLTRLHIMQGRGIMVNVQSTKPIQHYFIQQLLKQAQLSYQCIQGLFLRGSRALGIQIDEAGFDYLSDWDYYCVYKSSSSKINGKLIKLYNTDITIYDTDSFNKLLIQTNDLPALQLFFLPAQYQYINRLKYPPIYLGLLRESLGFHLNKSNRKIMRIDCQLSSTRNIRKRKMLQMKKLKALHLQIRFLDNFEQLKSNNKILDVKRVNNIWHEVKFQLKINLQMRHIQQYLRAIIKYKYQEIKNIQSIVPNQENNKNQVINEQKIKTNPLNLQLVNRLLTKGLQSLKVFRIGYHRHKLYPNLIQFYSTQSAYYKHRICWESRGIILDQNNHYKIISLPYYKFFDYNHPQYNRQSSFDFDDFKIYKKYDGSIAMMYYYEYQWWVSSARIPDGSNRYCFGKPQTITQFRKEFWKIFNQLGYKLPQQEDKDITFIFQILSKDHIIVTKRQQSDLVLHGAINRENGIEQSHQQFGKKYSWKTSEEINIQPRNLETIVKVAQSLDPSKQQGFVLRDKNRLRLKIRSTSYIKANWLSQLNLGGGVLNPQRYLLTEIIMKGDTEYFLSFYPQWKPMIDDLNQRIMFINSQCCKIIDGGLRYRRYRQRLSNQMLLQLQQKIESKNEYLRPFLYSLALNQAKWRNRLELLMIPNRFFKFIAEVRLKRPSKAAKEEDRESDV